MLVATGHLKSFNVALPRSSGLSIIIQLRVHQSHHEPASHQPISPRGHRRSCGRACGRGRTAVIPDIIFADSLQKPTYGPNSCPNGAHDRRADRCEPALESIVLKPLVTGELRWCVIALTITTGMIVLLHNYIPPDTTSHRRPKGTGQCGILGHSRSLTFSPTPNVRGKSNRTNPTVRVNERPIRHLAQHSNIR